MSTAPDTTPDRIVEIATGYMAARQLFGASRIGLFQALVGGPLSLSHLADSIEADPRVVSVLAGAMNGLGLLERSDDLYWLAPDAARYLTGQSQRDLAPFLAFLGQVSYPHWLNFDATVDTGVPGRLERTPEVRSVISAGVGRYFALHAEMLSQVFDFSPYRELLDFAGISPWFAIEALRANPHLQARSMVSPAVAGAFESAFAAAGFASRTTVDSADPMDEHADGGYDLALLCQVIHRFSPAENRTILATMRRGARPEARLVIVDFLLDEHGRQRRIDVLHAGEYAVVDGTVVYPVTEMRQWLVESGWVIDEILELPGGPRAVIATPA